MPDTTEAEEWVQVFLKRRLEGLLTPEEDLRLEFTLLCREYTAFGERLKSLAHKINNIKFE
jgi:hypothetical protein